MEELVYQCPGEAGPVSAAVHVARLEAGWNGCRDCVWNDSNSVKGAWDDVLQNELPRTARAGIRRTPFGVRGPYLNAVDRTTASQIAAVFVTHLAELVFDRRLNGSKQVAEEFVQETAAANDQQVIMAAPSCQVVVGFDDDPHSPDLFAGVVQAIRQAGANVVDTGRSTAASVLDAMKRWKADGSIIVTSAESESGDIGLDVFDEQGNALNIPWQKYGIRIRLDRADSIQSAPPSHPEPFAAEQFAADLRNESVPSPEVESVERSSSAHGGELILPNVTAESLMLFSRQRRCGDHTPDSAERAYRNSVTRWWQPKAGSQNRPTSPIRIYCRQSLAAARILELADSALSNIELIEARFSDDGLSPSGRQPVTVEIGRDDRMIQVWSKVGRLVTNSELVDWLNSGLSKVFQHVTAHLNHQNRMISLMDVAGPETAAAHDVTVDAVAILGLLNSLNRDGRHPLPL